MAGREKKSRCKITYKKIAQNIEPMRIRRPSRQYLAFIMYFDVFLDPRIWPIEEMNSIVTRNSQLHSLSFNSWASPRILSGLASVITILYRQTDLSGALGRDSFIPTALWRIWDGECCTIAFARLPDSGECVWEQQIEVHLLGACENIFCFCRLVNQKKKKYPQSLDWYYILSVLFSW